jgi:DNA-binding GntR family transcriptional regulator
MITRGAAPVRRTTLRSETQEAVRDRIIDGRLSPGTNVIERDLSEELGVSRTPLREALLGLEAERLLRTEPQRGFFVQELSVAEAREVYSLLALLEGFAVERSCPSPTDTLQDLNTRFRAAKDHAEAVQYDREWHQKLMRQCGLPRTESILQELRTAAARYEFRFFSGADIVAKSARQHDQILRALRKRDCRAAAALVRQNWEQGLQWVEQKFQR